MINIRNAEITDAERLVEIYGYYVKNTAITFEYDIPSSYRVPAAHGQTMRRYPYIVIEQDGVIQGYAYAGAFVGRAAYDWSCEVTVYLDKDTRKHGMGRRLYEALEEKTAQNGNFEPVRLYRLSRNRRRISNHKQR